MSAPRAYLGHAAPGRLRLAIPGRKGDARFFVETGHRLADYPEVIHAEGRPTTGSLVIRLKGDIAGLARRAESDGLFALDAAPLPVERLSSRFAGALDDTDRWLARKSGGRLDVAALLFLVLAGSAAVQALRGRVAAPAVSLGWYALNALLLSRLIGGSFANDKQRGE